MRGRAGLPPTLVLTLVAVAGAFAVALPLALAVIDPTPLPRGFEGEQHQDAETTLYLLAFVVLLPLALVAVPRLSDRVAAGPNGPGLPALAALLAASLMALIAVARIADRLTSASGELLLLGAAVVWWALAAATVGRALRPRPWERLLRLARHEAVAWVAAATLTLGALLALTAVSALSVPALLAGVTLASGAFALYARGGIPMPRGGWGIALDLAVAGLLLLAIPDLVVFSPENAGGNFPVALETAVIQFHQDFLLGPANQVLAGNAVLVDTSSQYGVAPIYLLAGWFQLAPIGYGTFGFLDGLLTALYFVAGYAVLRLAGVGRVLAAGAMALAVAALAYNHIYPVGGIPQQGPLRFGLPMLLVLTAVLAVRVPRWATPARAAGFAVVGLSAIWSIEAFAYTATTFAGLVAMELISLPSGRAALLGRRAIAAVAACVAAHLLFALLTLVFAGELPDWGQYFAYLDQFTGRLGDLTYDVSPWSPAFAVGAALVASAAALTLVVVRYPELLRSEPVALTALAGTTAYGIALFSYYVDRSGDHILPYVSLPALISAVVWLALVLRSSGAISRGARLGALAFALALGVLMGAAAWPATSDRVPGSALAHALPGGDSFRDAIHRLWNPPALDPDAPGGVALVGRYMPGQDDALTILPPDLGLEILFRSGRSSALPFGDPWEDSFVPAEHHGPLRAAIEQLPPGERMLVERRGLAALAANRDGRAVDRLTGFRVSAGLAPLQGWALRAIARRFRLRTIHRGPGEFIVVELVPRRLGPASPATSR